MRLGTFVNTEISIDDVALHRLWTFTCAAEGEISAIGEVDVTQQGVHVTNMIHFMKQRASYGGTIIDYHALVELMEQYECREQDPRRLRFWFHTHGDMAAFFSHTDETTISKLTTVYGWDLLVAACFNRQGQTMWKVVSNSLELVPWSFTIPTDAPSCNEIAEVRPIINTLIRPLHTRFRLIRGRFGHGRYRI